MAIDVVRVSLDNTPRYNRNEVTLHRIRRTYATGTISRAILRARAGHGSTRTSSKYENSVTITTTRGTSVSPYERLKDTGASVSIIALYNYNETTTFKRVLRKRIRGCRISEKNPTKFRYGKHRDA